MICLNSKAYQTEVKKMPLTHNELEKKKCLLQVLVLVFAFHKISLGDGMKIVKSAYHDVVIDILEAVPSNLCNSILENLEITLKTTSEHLFKSLDGRAYFGSLIINIPTTWPESCAPTGQFVSPSQGEDSDITITGTNILYGDRIWTQQSGGCGKQGDQLYVPFRSLEGKHAGKELLKEWAKYRYGIFDEIGFYEDKIYPQCYFTDSMRVNGCSDGSIKDIGLCTNPNPYVDMVKTLNKTARSSIMYVPQVEGVTFFCDKATHDRYTPTKHNHLCDRKSTLEVILRHKDFAPENLASSTTVTNTTPIFYYRRRVMTRYVVVIDETQDILLRESWSFLRNAIRKWVVYDLQPNSEVGIFLAGGNPTGKILPITMLDMQKNKDLVASFVPYAPADSRQALCISCALQASLDMLENRRQKQGNASHVIVVLAPGMDLTLDIKELTKNVEEAKARIVTINFPAVVRRHPLDKLATQTGGKAFTIYEKKYNSEKSYLDTYFELTEILFYISQKFYEGPIYQRTQEIHRKKLVDISSDFTTQSKRPNRIFQGSFFLDGQMGRPTGFFIYTHNAETPLIQNMRLISPTGVIYNTRSDQRMPVKQLTLLASINETGAWAYMIERFNGNPQPHFVQVIATPVAEAVNTVRVRAWLTALQPAGPFIVFCEVKRGHYPIHSAYVKMTITRPNVSCNYTVCEDNYKLLDTGAGDPDITKGDGIYSRYVTINTGPGLYKIDIFVDDSGNTAHSLQDNASVQNLPCCGSSIPTKQTRQIVPFQRYLPPITFHLTQEDIDTATYIPIGRIGDLIITYLDGGKVRLTWTTPDMGGENVARYEIKFAFSIEDIVDRYETAAILWNHETPYPYEVGDISSFILDINLEPLLFGQAVFFAIRPFAKLATNAIGGLVSNAVRTYVPNKIEPTETLPLTTSTVGFSQEDGVDLLEIDVTRNKTFAKGNLDVNVMYSIPLIAGTLCVLIIIGIYYLVCFHRCRKIKNGTMSQQNVTSKQDGNSNEIPNSGSNIGSNSNQDSSKSTPSSSPIHTGLNESSSIHATTTTLIHDYASLDTSDHHTIGIPVYKNHDDMQKNRLSTSDSFKGTAQITSHDYLINDRTGYPNELNQLPVYYTSNCSAGGLSIISAHSENATLPRPCGPRPILSPYESWTTSKLLYERERRNSPLDEMLNQVNLKNMHRTDYISNGINGTSINECGPPPVPPLPYAPDIFPYPYVYGTMPKQNHEPTVNIYSTVLRSSPDHQQQQPSISYPNQTFNGTGNSSASDKKRRNVTMV